MYSIIIIIVLLALFIKLQEGRDKFGLYLLELTVEQKAFVMH